MQLINVFTKLYIERERERFCFDSRVNVDHFFEISVVYMQIEIIIVSSL